MDLQKFNKILQDNNVNLMISKLPTLCRYIFKLCKSQEELGIKYDIAYNIIAFLINNNETVLALEHIKMFLVAQDWNDEQLAMLKSRLAAALTNTVKDDKNSPLLREAEEIFVNVLNEGKIKHGLILRETKRNYCTNILNQRNGAKLLSLIKFSYFYDISIHIIEYNKHNQNKFLCEHQIRQMLKNDYACPVNELMIPKIPQKLFKYREFNDNNISALRKSKLYLCDPEKFNDPFDPIFRISPEYKAYQSLIAPKIIIGSLSGVNDNILMWSHYANAHTGFCLEYDLSDFLKALPKYTTIRAVRYTNKLKITPPIPIYTDEYFHSILDMFALKYSAWEYEQEYRILSHQDDQFLTLPISAIYVGKDITKENMKKIREAIKHHKSAELYQMTPDIENPYKLNKVKVF